MKLPRAMNALSPAAWAVSAVTVILAAILFWWFVTEPGRQRDRAAASGAQATISDGRAKAGADAVGEVIATGKAADAIDAQVKGSEDAIRNAAPADRDGATVRELCRLKGNRGNPECRLLQPRP